MNGKEVGLVEDIIVTIPISEMNLPEEYRGLNYHNFEDYNLEVISVDLSVRGVWTRVDCQLSLRKFTIRRFNWEDFFDKIDNRDYKKQFLIEVL